MMEQVATRNNASEFTGCVEQLPPLQPGEKLVRTHIYMLPGVFANQQWLMLYIHGTVYIIARVHPKATKCSCRSKTHIGTLHNLHVLLPRC